MKLRSYFAKPGSIAVLFFSLGLLTAAALEQTFAQAASWSFQSIRDEIDPGHWVSEEVLFDGKPTLVLSGEGNESVNGSWTCTFDVQPDGFYQFVTYFKAVDVPQVDRSVLAQITWLTEEGNRIGFIEFPGIEANPNQGEWHTIKQKYQVPAKAFKARIDLIFRWNLGGRVYFGETKLAKSEPIESRLVRLGAIHHRPQAPTTSKKNLEEFSKYIDQAGGLGADIVCLPEGITVVGTGKTYLEVSEPIPGPTTRFLGNLAEKHQMYIVAGLLEKDGPVLYNTAVILDRQGQLMGKYRKVALPREEIEGGITPGVEFPVFETDFGKVGMMICWDVFFPEPARMLAFQGAEIIFMPIWGGDLILSKARAIENQVYLVSSTYDMKTGVFDRKGSLIKEGTEEHPVAVVEVDLNQRELWPWIGEFKNRIRREMPAKKTINY